ncbi:MAG: HAD-IIIA family hydrolase [Rhodospirillales bacterium]|nr:HAD-IIIA family hydrolase [Rhodospirillales bacterium]
MQIPPLPDGTSIDDDGLWSQVLRPFGADTATPALFLDRDGVVVEEVHYLHKVEDIHIIDGAAAVVARANGLGLPVIMVTNQAGIGYGMYGWAEFMDVQDVILNALAEDGAFFDGIYACPHHSKGQAPYNNPDHPARKPNPGMLLQAARQFPIDLKNSWIVGDRAGDVEAGRNAGLTGGIHVRTGHGAEDAERDRALSLGTDRYRALEAASIADALELIPLLAEEG